MVQSIMRRDPLSTAAQRRFYEILSSISKGERKRTLPTELTEIESRKFLSIDFKFVDMFPYCFWTAVNYDDDNNGGYEFRQNVLHTISSNGS